MGAKLGSVPAGRYLAIQRAPAGTRAGTVRRLRGQPPSLRVAHAAGTDDTAAPAAHFGPASGGPRGASSAGRRVERAVCWPEGAVGRAEKPARQHATKQPR